MFLVTNIILLEGFVNDSVWFFGDFSLLRLYACSPEALVVAQRCHCAWRRLLFSASPEKSNQKRGDFFRRSNLVFIRELRRGKADYAFSRDVLRW
jgi:hypothetical protein